jgi:hypothetical protein
MELKRGLAAVVAARDTPPAGLRDQLCLDAPTPKGNPLQPASLAAVAAAALQGEHRQAVARASADCVLRRRLRVEIPPPPPICSWDLPAIEPIPDRGDRPVHGRRYVTQARTGLRKPLELVSVGRSSWRELAHEHMFPWRPDGSAYALAMVPEAALEETEAGYRDGSLPGGE